MVADGHLSSFSLFSRNRDGTRTWFRHSCQVIACPRSGNARYRDNRARLQLLPQFAADHGRINRRWDRYDSSADI